MQPTIKAASKPRAGKNGVFFQQLEGGPRKLLSRISTSRSLAGQNCAEVSGRVQEKGGAEQTGREGWAQDDGRKN